MLGLIDVIHSINTFEINNLLSMHSQWYCTHLSKISHGLFRIPLIHEVRFRFSNVPDKLSHKLSFLRRPEWCVIIQLQIIPETLEPQLQLVRVLITEEIFAQSFHSRLYIVPDHVVVVWVLREEVLKHWWCHILASSLQNTINCSVKDHVACALEAGEGVLICESQVTQSMGVTQLDLVRGGWWKGRIEQNKES